MVRVDSRSILIAACLGGFLASCAAPPSPPRNVLLVTADTLRPDQLGAYGNPTVRTPSLDRLARGGVLFENARSSIPSTLPSHSSILTGLLPPGHGVHDNGVYYLAERHETLAELLGNAGFDTAAFVAAFVLDRRFGIHQGFATYGDEMEEPLRAGAAEALGEGANPLMQWWMDAWHGSYQRPGDSVVREAGEWLAGLSEAPFFLWTHLFDPHEPYAAPGPLERLYDPDYQGPMDGTGTTFYEAQVAGTIQPRDVDHLRRRYAGEVTYTDGCVGRLLRHLDLTGERSRTLIVFTSDHGEGLGEHDYYFEHASRIWDTVLRVPMVLSGPGAPAARIVANRVRTVDLLPTCLDLLGQPPREAIHGESLVPEMAGQATERPTYSEAQCGLQSMPVPESWRSLVTGDWKLVVRSPRGSRAAAPSVALFRIGEDPSELNDLAAERPVVAEDLMRRIARIAAEEETDADASFSTRAMDDETVDKLRALGYVK